MTIQVMNLTYENILKAMNGGKPGEGLTTQQQSENYEIFSKMMREGVYIPDLIQKINALETKVDEMSKPKESVMDAQLFAVMEQAVREDPSVQEARRRLQTEKTRIISELCMQDETYRKLFNEYRTTVNSAYIDYKGQS